MPIRGKILNCLKADYDKIFKSEIITDLLKVLGCGVEVKSKANKNLSSFDMNALRWSKIILCTDADVDGFQIRTLLLTMLYRLTPTLIEEGKVFIAESPLYEITSKNDVYFAYDEVEKDKFIEQLGKEKIHNSAFKRSWRKRTRYDEPYHNEPRVTQTYQGSSCRCRTDSGNF